MSNLRCVTPIRFNQNSSRSAITHSLWQALPRGLALFLGVFSLLNLLTRLLSPRAEENLWWIDLRWLPPGAGNAIVLCSTVCLLAFAFHPARSVWRRSLTIACIALLMLACLVNGAQFYVLAARGRIGLGLPVPLSLFLSA